MPRSYLAVDQGRRQRWRDRWQTEGGRVIGLAWRHPDAAVSHRSVPFGPLLEAVLASGRVLASLQRGMSDEERSVAANRIRIEPDWDPDDVDDLAARAADRKSTRLNSSH